MQPTILITGGAGFIGSHFINYFHAKYPHLHLLNVDKLGYAADLQYLTKTASSPNYSFVHGDITAVEMLETLFEQHAIEGLIHFAAESHVDNSIASPRPFIETNITGTFNLLEAARRAWLSAPFKLKKGYEKARFHQISTDEVYGSLGAAGLFKETSPYRPNSPYSASKAGADMLVRAYHKTFGLPTVITNCSNNYGPHQHAEKLIPTIIRKALAGEPIPIYGDGKNVRDWLFVEDHCEAIDCVFQAGKVGEVYNVGGGNEIENINLARQICSLLESLRPSPPKPYADLITFVKDRAGHDKRYAIDAGKIRRALGWQPRTAFEVGLRKTINWYLDFKFKL